MVAGLLESGLHVAPKFLKCPGVQEVLIRANLGLAAEGQIRWIPAAEQDAGTGRCEEHQERPIAGKLPGVVQVPIHDGSVD
jgi:hypothetical protein